MLNNYIDRIASATGLPTSKITNTVKLLEEGATIPFISRYRKEVTGSLDEVQIATIQEQLQKLRDLDKRRETIIASIEEQGKMTPQLLKKINSAYELNELEDLYLPFKRKRKTRASIARENGLEPLAEKLLQQDNFNINEFANQLLSDKVPTLEDALKGARDIIAEQINETEEARNSVRRSFKEDAFIIAKLARGKEKEAAKYQDYFEYSEKLSRCPSHRLLAIRRGEEEGFLRVKITPEEEDALYHLEKIFVQHKNQAGEQVAMAVEDGYKRLLAPSIETEFRNLAKAKADEEAIQVFTENLRQLLLAAPLGQRSILALDPGFRTGCKVVCLDAQGNLIHNGTIYPHPPQSKTNEAVADIKRLVTKYKIDALAIGNGTAGRETYQLFAGVDYGRPVDTFMVNESGASIYSASSVAREEFPDKDVTVRGAVSIGRRLMDPLAELVKIDPKSIGVGQYQHDVQQNMLKESLDRTVESCVNSVGINVNTASKHLLTYVSGLGPTLAQNIVDYRSENGQFKQRKQLLKVARMGDKAYEQAAGFLRIRNGKHPLDNTAVHPERYALVEQMAKDLGTDLSGLLTDRQLRQKIDLKKYISDKVGLPTLKDIMGELEKPGLDPRGAAKAIEFSKSIQTIEDLKEGMVVTGVINNVTNFGAFVDIGIKESGLVHISQLANHFVKNPADVVKLGQQVEARVMGVDLERKRVQLSMKDN